MQSKSLLLTNRWPILLFILISVVVIGNFIWLKIDTSPPVGNSLQDLFPGIYFYLDLIHSDIGFKDLLTIFKSLSLAKHFLSMVSNYIRDAFFTYPPLVPISYASFYLLFGPNSEIELMANSIYLAIALLSIYGIGKYFFNKKTGLLASFIFASFPGIISISREIYAEFIMMCLVAATLYFLLKTNFFRSSKYSIALGVSLSLTALAKWEFPPAFVGPFLLILWKSYALSKQESWNREENKKCRINFLLSFIIAFAISSIWYVPSFNDIVQRLFVRSDENILINSPTTFYPLPFSIITLTYYPLAIINTHIGFFYFLVLFLIGISFIYRSIKNKLSLTNNKFFYLLFLGLWIIIPYICFTFVKIHAPSHIMLILPAIAIIISAGISSFYNRIIRITFISLVILYGLGSFLHSFLNLKELRPVYGLKIFVDNEKKISLTATKGYYMRDDWEKWCFRPPDSRDWKIKNILSYIKEDSKNMSYKPLVLVIIRQDRHGPVHFQSFQFQYYNLLNNYQLYILPTGNERVKLPEDRSRFDYIVINTMRGNIIDENNLRYLVRYTPNISPDFKINSFAANFSEKYRLAKEYALPDNHVSKIYRLIND